MNNLPEGSYVRAERQRRYELNRLIVDQHIRSNDTFKDSSTYPVHPSPYIKPSKYNNSYPQQQYRLPSLKANSNSNLEGISDRTDVYLSNC